MAGSSSGSGGYSASNSDSTKEEFGASTNTGPVINFGNANPPGSHTVLGSTSNIVLYFVLAIFGLGALVFAAKASK